MGRIFPVTLGIFALSPGAAPAQEEPAEMASVERSPSFVDPAEESRQAEEADRARRMAFFNAIADADKTAFCAMLNAGMDPDAELPSPPPEDFRRRFADERLHYYVSSEKGFTALMLATALENHTFVKILLLAGADRWKMTQRHRTYALWLAAKSGNIAIMRTLMGISPDHESHRFRIAINLMTQRAVLWKDGTIALDTPISSGRDSHPTPKGAFLVTDKYRNWKSTLYHARMPYFLRLSCGDFGLHQGALPGYPASHGCIRLPEKSARELFATVPVGTLVEIQ
ncbi:MAG TPA: L,D-transpeptidase family protein [Terrimicrobiaceae bacterium]|nr:L,D-transpeptidase family protein [Terrimicrobiaceae bacterium]